MPKLRVRSRSHKYRRIVAAVMNAPWAILPEKLEEIVELIDLRSQGLVFTAEEIQARIGSGRSRELVERQASQIAVLNLFGTITQRANAFQEFSGGTSAEMFGRAFDEAVRDPNVSAIVINVDSPGGAVPGVPELAEQIFAARGTKPIIAVANPVMASAALWIASQADEIVAVPSATAVGSIGVMVVHVDQSAADEKLGIKRTILTSSEFKAEGNPYEPLSEEARKWAEKRIDAVHDSFVAAVARGRGVSVDTVEKDFGRGRTMLAQDALAAGLVDRIATLDTVLSELGVSQAPSSTERAQARTTPLAHSPLFDRSLTMDKEVFQALVRLNLCNLDTPEAEAQAALRGYFAAKGEPLPTARELILKGLAGKIDQPTAPAAPAAPAAPVATATATVGGDKASVQDIVASIALTALPAEQKLELQTELVAQAGKLSHREVIEKINAAVSAQVKPVGATSIAVTADAVDKFKASARDAILERTWGPGNAPKQIFDVRTGGYVDWKPAGRNYGLMSLMKIAEQCLLLAGVPQQKLLTLAPMHVAQLVMGANPANFGIFVSSDGPAYNVSGMFSNLLLDASNVMLRRSYDDTRVTFQDWMKQGPSVPDFKTVNKVIAGELNDPKAVPEDGEFEETTLSDGKETYKLTVWGSIFSHSWQLVVNDALGSFMEIPRKLGSSMRRKHNRLAYQHLKDNGALSDSVALFDDSTHNNLTTGALTTAQDYVTAWNTMTEKMGSQTGLDADSAVLNTLPKFVVFPLALRGIIRTTLGSPSVAINTGGNSGTTNIWQQGLMPVEEGELGAATTGGSDTAFYLAADPMSVDTIEYAFLQGLETPVIEQETAFDRLAIRQRIYHAFAVKALDHRGLQRHNGA